MEAEGRGFMVNPSKGVNRARKKGNMLRLKAPNLVLGIVRRRIVRLIAIPRYVKVKLSKADCQARSYPK